jgi:endonuclease/exonuclease/phosphatase family metal-dependent hydrolase
MAFHAAVMSNRHRLYPTCLLRLTGQCAYLLGLVLLLTACSSGEERQPVASAEVALRVMTFNIEWGGTHVSFENVVEAIRRSNADIVGIQEAEGNLQRLAADLGWYYDLRNYVISRHPLIDPPGANGQYLFVEIAPGRFVAVANVHLPSDPYGPDAVRDGASANEVLAIENRTRLPNMLATLDALDPLIAGDIPLFITGDFNAPAHTDWTAAAVGARPFLRYALEWPVSVAVTSAGFRDSWRDHHQDVVLEPGLTWWAGRPPLALYAPGDNDPQDRIDFVWYSGPVSVHSSELVGEIDGPGVSISVSPWPSDHRAVVSAFVTIPAVMPMLVSSARRVYSVGEDIDITFRQAVDSTVRVERVDDDGTRTMIAERPATGDGSMRFAAELFEAGHYRIRLRDGNGSFSLHRDVWVLSPDAVPMVEVIGTSFEYERGIDVRWRNAPGNRNDYVAMVRLDAAGVEEDELPWAYVGSMPQGQLRLDVSSAEWGWPPADGTYVVRLLKDDGYEPLAQSPSFTIR